MTKRQRQIIFYLFSIIFIIITPLVLLKVSGYSFDQQRQLFVRSGILLVEVEPSDSTVRINGVRDIASPRSRGVVRIPLQPGAFTIALEKEGYVPWTQEVVVTPGGVTAPPPVKLIRTTQSFVILPFLTNTVYPSLDRRWLLTNIVSANQRQYILLDQTRGALQSLTNSPKELRANGGGVTEVQWSPDSTKILFIMTTGKARRGTVYLRSRNEFTPLITLPPIVRWASSSNALYVVEGDTIRSVPIDNAQVGVKYIADNVADILSFRSELLVLQKNNGSLILSSISQPTTSPISQSVGNLPLESRFLISAFPYPLIKTPTLVLILGHAQNSWKTITEVPSSEYQSVNQEELITVDHGKLYAIRENKPDQVLSAPIIEKEPLQMVLDLPETPWVALVTSAGLSLHSKPIDPVTVSPLHQWQPTIQRISLDQQMNISSISSDPLGRRLYLKGSRGNEQGIFVRILTE